MNAFYETKISDARWIVYDIFGNIGWITYVICLILAFVKLDVLFSAIGVVPAAFILLGLGELISERIVKLDRVLPFARLLRGFGALTLGGGAGLIIALIAVILHYHVIYLIMTIGAALCFVFVALLLIGYKKQS